MLNKPNLIHCASLETIKDLQQKNENTMKGSIFVNYCFISYKLTFITSMYIILHNNEIVLDFWSKCTVL